MKFIGRQTELTKLNAEYNRDSSFVVIYGRRRVGKTTLIKEFLKGLYFISDNFIRFWFRYVYPYKGELELDNMQILLDEISKDFIEKFVAFAYEDICKDIFASLCRKETISFVPSRIGSYWLNDFDGDTEIAMMAHGWAGLILTAILSVWTIPYLLRSWLRTIVNSK